jgi:hypothetical protein
MSGYRFSLWRFFFTRPDLWLGIWFEARDRKLTMGQVILEAIERQQHRQP